MTSGARVPSDFALWYRARVVNVVDGDASASVIDCDERSQPSQWPLNPFGQSAHL